MKTPIDVLSVHWGMAPGGVARYAALLEDTRHFAPIRLHSACIRSRAWPLAAWAQELHCEDILIRGRADARWLPRLVSAIRRVRPRLVMAHGFNGYVAVQTARRVGRITTPLVCSFHGPYHASTGVRRLLERPINNLSEGILRRHADAVVAVAHHCRNYLVRQGVNPSKVTVIHNGIDDAAPLSIAERTEARRSLGVEGKRFLCGTLSRLEPVKGIEHLLRAWPAVLARRPDALAVIIGSGPEEGRLKALAQELGISAHVLFAGHRGDVHQCLSALDVFVLPSLMESHSIALLEAMRAGAAVVATDVGGNGESVTPGAEGLLVPPADSALLGQALVRLAKDSELRGRMGRRARERFLREFTRSRMASRTAEWLVSCAR